MAFKNIKGIRVKCVESDEIYILADCFAVYQNHSETPTVYEWNDITRITEAKTCLIFTTIDKIYKIYKKSFDSDTSYLSALAIIEGACADYSIPFSHLKRLIVTKDKYIDAELPMSAFAASGFIDENEMASIYSSIRNNFISKILFSFAIIICAIVFFVLVKTFDVSIEIIPFFLFIAIISGAIFATLFFLIQHQITKSLIIKMVKNDPSVNFQITYAISKSGFVEIESFLFSRENYISWKEVDSYIDTNKAIVILKGNTPLMKLPKRLFTRDEVRQILDLIDECISER